MSLDIFPDSTGTLTRIHTCSSDLVGVAQAGTSYRLMAVRIIPRGTLLTRIEGAPTPSPTRYSLQIGKDLHMHLEDGHSEEEILHRYFWRFLNHSCAPNTRILNREVIALRNISEGEDVTFDYNTSEYEIAEPFACHCGSPHCLGTIRGFKYLTAAQQQRLEPLLAPHLSCLVPHGDETAQA